MSDPIASGGRQPMDGHEFREVMTSFPTGVVIVTTTDSLGQPWGFTSNAMASVSADPPMLLVCAAKTSRSLPAILESRGFLVNFMAEGSEAACSVFASKAPPGVKFGSVEWRLSDSCARPHLFADSVAYADCETEREIDAGSHVILVARIVEGSVTDRSRNPVAYFKRSYRRWPADSAP